MAGSKFSQSGGDPSMTVSLLMKGSSSTDGTPAGPGPPSEGAAGGGPAGGGFIGPGAAGPGITGAGAPTGGEPSAASNASRSPIWVAASESTFCATNCGTGCWPPGGPAGACGWAQLGQVACPRGIGLPQLEHGVWISGFMGVLSRRLFCLIFSDHASGGNRRRSNFSSEHGEPGCHPTIPATRTSPPNSSNEKTRRRNVFSLTLPWNHSPAAIPATRGTSIVADNRAVSTVTRPR